MDALGFHPLIERWFAGRFAGPTEPQRRGWPAIAAGEHTLIAAPTGSGKTLTAFLAVIDRLVRESIETPLPDEIRVVYVSPLRALSNDMQRNLQQPLGEMASLAELTGMPFPALRVGLRTGDTTAAARAALLRKPPHILVTTPESLYLLLTTTKGRERLRNVDTVIVDEIHALLRDKRGSHLSLSLERLAELCPQRIQRIGLSATQKPLELVANFLIGMGPKDTLPQLHQCTIVDVGHQRQLDLAIEVPFAGLGAVCTHEQWAIVHQRIVELIQGHRSTLIFVNTRRMAERLTHQLSTLLGEDQVSSHHGSLSTDMRLKTEQRLKNGEIKAVVATASLELGIDIGYIDLVVQIGSPRSIAAFLQRTGRAGHSLHAIPKSRLFALTRDELGECAALIRAVRSGILDTLRVPVAPLDILVQQIVAETAHDESSAESLFDLVRRAYPYRNLTRQAWDDALKMCSEGFTENAGRSRSLLYHDRVGQRVKARPAAKLAAIGNAGAIPETGQYRVVALPENTVIGSVDEDFAVESTRGDIFLLGNTSWRIEHVRTGDVVVSDAHNAPPSIPFWFGEAPGRTLELSEEISRLRDELVARLDEPAAAAEWLAAEASIAPLVAEEFVEYVRSQLAAIGVVPTQQRVVFERFFDESGGMQLVIHAPFGSAINRAWGYALRKRFCRSFDFELQATADDDGVILSLGPQHSFPLESLFGMLTSENVQSLLEQAILVQPPFQLRWRWNVTRSLFVMRQKFGKKVPPALQRFRSDDLLTSVFPQLTGCLENHTGDIELPDHPLVKQTMHDCLHEALDLDGLITVLQRIESGDIKLIPRDTREPSPFCYELLNSSPYAFLDGGEIQERRARVVAPGSDITTDSPDLTWLDPVAIQQVVQEATPLVRHRDELHDLLLGVVMWPSGGESHPGCFLAAGMLDATFSAVPTDKHPGCEEAAGVRAWFDKLVTERRAWAVPLADGRSAWVATERFPYVQALGLASSLPPGYALPGGIATEMDSIAARMSIARGWMEICGPVTAEELAAWLSWTPSQTAAILEALEGEGTVMRGRYRPRNGVQESLCATGSASVFAHSDINGLIEEQTLAEPVAHNTTIEADDAPLDWCHRRLLARIHRLTLAGLRKQIEPVAVPAFQRFLFHYHGLNTTEPRTGVNGLYEVIAQLQGLDLPAVTWERDILPARLPDYQPGWIDDLCLAGEVGWGRLFPPTADPEKPRSTGVTRVVPIALFLRGDLPWLMALDADETPEVLRGLADEIREHLTKDGALFATDLLACTRMLPTHLEDALGELIARGLVTADSFVGLRSLIAERRDITGRAVRSEPKGLLRRRPLNDVSGRWSLWRRSREVFTVADRAERLQSWAWQLIRRWGVVFRDLLAVEDGAPKWWELVPIFRRLEARGELRGGRFITGVAGEQFALESTVQQLRQFRDPAPTPTLIATSAADPLNMVGILTAPPRVPASASNRVAYREGIPVAAVQGGEVVWLASSLTREEKGTIRAVLLGIPEPVETAETPTGENSENDDPSTKKPRRSSSPSYPNRIPRPLIS